MREFYTSGGNNGNPKVVIARGVYDMVPDLTIDIGAITDLLGDRGGLGVEEREALTIDFAPFSERVLYLVGRAIEDSNVEGYRRGLESGLNTLGETVHAANLVKKVAVYVGHDSIKDVSSSGSDRARVKVSLGMLNHTLRHECGHVVDTYVGGNKGVDGRIKFASKVANAGLDIECASLELSNPNSPIHTYAYPAYIMHPLETALAAMAANIVGRAVYWLGNNPLGALAYLTSPSEKRAEAFASTNKSVTPIEGNAVVLNPVEQLLKNAASI